MVVRAAECRRCCSARLSIQRKGIEALYLKGRTCFGTIVNHSRAYWINIRDRKNNKWLDQRIYRSDNLCRVAARNPRRSRRFLSLVSNMRTSNHCRATGFGALARASAATAKTHGCSRFDCDRPGCRGWVSVADRIGAATHYLCAFHRLPWHAALVHGHLCRAPCG